MTGTRQLRKNKLLWVVMILIGVLAVFAYLTLYTGAVVLRKTDSTEVIHKLKNIQDKGGEFTLTQKDMDEVSNLYFGKAKTKGNITLSGVNLEMVQDELLIQAPVSYKNLDLLFSSIGKVGFLNGEITYAADSFKIGKISLPKALVFSQISKLADGKLYVEDNLIKINPSVFPFKINDFKISDSKILGVAQKLDIKMLFEDLNKKSEEEIDKDLDTVSEKIGSASIIMNNEEKEKIKEIQNTIDNVKGKSIEEKKKAISDAIDNLDKAINKTGDSDKKEELEKIKAEVEKVEKATAEKEKKANEETEIKRAALRKVESELSGAYSQVESSKEKQIVSIMLSTTSKMVANPSYDSSADQATVKSIYATLDPDSKNRVKSALFSNVGGDSLAQLSKAFGM